MVYNKNNLASGATITKAALDNMENGIAAAAERPTSGTASSTTFFRGDGVWAAPPVGGGSGGGVPYVLYADAPPSGSGLTAIAADNSTDDTARIQAAIDYVKNTYGGGEVVLPPKTIKCNSTINIVGVTLRGVAGTIINCRGMSTSGTAFKVKGKNCLVGVRLEGPNSTEKLSYQNNSCKAIDIYGIGSSIRDVDVQGFFYGLDTTNSDTFGMLVDNCSFGNCGVCVDLDQSAAHNGGSQITEHGERMVFQNCVFWNSQKGVVASGSGVDAFFFACSFDYIGVMLENYDAFIHVIGCHLETGYAPSDNGNWGTVNRHMVVAALTARFQFSNNRFEVRDSGVYALMTPDAGPATYNSGFVRLDGTNTWYGQLPAETRQFNDRDMAYWSANDATKKMYSPFMNKWSPVTAAYVANDGTPQPSGHRARISAQSVSSNDGNLPEYSVTLSRELLSGASAADGWIEVRY